MKKRSFVYLVVFLLIVGYILIDSGLSSTEAKSSFSLMNGEASYTENVSLDQIMRGMTQYTLYVQYCGAVSGPHNEAILKINNTNSNLTFNATQYDSNVFSKSGDGSSYLSFKTLNKIGNNKCGD